jgi:LPS sulfotransferase NodH
MNDGIRYSIISTPRSGTTYLCSLLQKTGRMGNPEEYFNDDLIPTYQEKLKLEGNPQSYLDKIIWQSI